MLAMLAVHHCRYMYQLFRTIIRRCLCDKILRGCVSRQAVIAL